MITRLLSSHGNPTWSRISSRLTYANVMSTIAVFLALGGGSMAAVSGDKDSGGQAAENQNGSGGNDKSDKGDKDNDGGDGNGGNNDGSNDSSNGNTDVNAALNVTTREGDPVKSDPSSDQADASASCEDGETLVGGGVRTNSEKEQVRGQTNESKPMVMSSGPDGKAWSARVMDYAGVGVTATAYAICASSGSSK